MSVPDAQRPREPRVPASEAIRGAASDLRDWWRYFFFPAIVFMLLGALGISGCFAWDRIRDHERRLDAIGAPETYDLP